jgi:hypothetical protein
VKICGFHSEKCSMAIDGYGIQNTGKKQIREEYE